MGEQLALDLDPYDYAWRVQCTHHRIDERTGEPFRWVLGCWSQASAELTAMCVRREHPGVEAVALRR